MFIFSWTFLAYRIHSSETTAGLLEEIGGFHLEYRGVTEIKVKFDKNDEIYLIWIFFILGSR